MIGCNLRSSLDAQVTKPHDGRSQIINRLKEKKKILSKAQCLWTGKEDMQPGMHTADCGLQQSECRAQRADRPGEGCHSHAGYSQPHEHVQQEKQKRR